MYEIEKRKSAVGVPDRREEVIEMLNEAFARNLIEMEEFEERMDAVHSARYLEELEQLVEDIPVQLLKSTRGSEDDPWVDAFKSQVILGTKKLSGDWLKKRGASLKVVLSSMTVDCRNLKLPEGITTLKISNMLSTLELIVPPGLTVENEVRDVLSTMDTDPLLNRVKKSSDAVLRLCGSSLLGTLKIKVKQ